MFAHVRVCKLANVFFAIRTRARDTNLPVDYSSLSISTHSRVSIRLSPFGSFSFLLSLLSLSLSLSLSLLLFVRRRFCLYAGNIRDAGRERERERESPAANSPGMETRGGHGVGSSGGGCRTGGR